MKGWDVEGWMDGWMDACGDCEMKRVVDMRRKGKTAAGIDEWMEALVNV